MARPLRIEFEGAIYHVMSRGNARQQIVKGTDDWAHLQDRLAATVGRFNWELFAFVLMPNHLHLFVRTPQANLSRGMQHLLSSYANWFCRRHRRPGHLFQGRYRAELVEDESYYWEVSRYIHLNPVRTRKPLVEQPEDWPWSSYPGYRDRRKRVSWVSYESVLSAWKADAGGRNAQAAYRDFVESGLRERSGNPFDRAQQGWILGGDGFVQQVRSLIAPQALDDQIPEARRLKRLEPEQVIDAVANFYGVEPQVFRTKRAKERSRNVAAWLARNLTQATLRELAPYFGLSHPESLSNLTRRVEQSLEQSPELRKETEMLKRQLL